MRMQPPFKPNHEEIRKRVRMLAFMKDAGLGLRIQESVMLYDKPSFKMVEEYVMRYTTEQAEVLLSEYIDPRTKQRRPRGRPLQQTQEEPFQGEQED